MHADLLVSIVVLNHDRPRELAQVLGQLCLLPERPRIIVVDNGSPDAMAVTRITRAHGSRVKLVRSEVNLGAAGRNLGVEHVHTPYVAFCDDDTAWRPGALRRACDWLEEHPHIGVVNGKVLVGEQEIEDPACTRMRDSPLDNTGLPGPALISFMAGAVVMRTRAFRQARGYEPRLFLGAEEALMALNLAALGWRMVYAADVVTRHMPSPLRDKPRRDLLLARNRLWVAWLRLPWADAWRESRVILQEAMAKGQLWPVLRRSFRGALWVMLHRRVVPDVVAEMHRTVFAPTAPLPQPQPRLTPHELSQPDMREGP